jgi:hypothetical protein
MRKKYKIFTTSKYFAIKIEFSKSEIENMVDREENDKIYKCIKNAVIIASILGVIVTVIFIISGKESYSALYLVPDSYSNYVDGNKVSFVYGIKCFERERTKYILEIYFGDMLADTRVFELNYGETLEQKEEILLPTDISFPVKISLVLKAKNNTEEVHFWLKGRK